MSTTTADYIEIEDGNGGVLLALAESSEPPQVEASATPLMRNQRWSEEAVTDLRAMAGQGMPLASIAVELRRSEISIRSKASELRLSLRKPKPAELPAS